MLTVSAYAKINLTLEILGKRDDGYHQISSVLQTVDITDIFSFEQDNEITFRSGDFPGIQTDLLEGSILSAAKLIREETGYSGGALIQLTKLGIPRACGLGSSSTDSAAVLKGLNDLWSLNLSLTELTALASRLGSDTPFFIRGGTALVEGRGEEITPLPSPDPFGLVLIIPRVNPMVNKTAKMYHALTSSYYTDGGKTNAMVFNLLHQESLLPDMIYNAFENVVGQMFPGFDECRMKCEHAGMVNIHLAGSGPAFFSLLPVNIDDSILLGNLADSEVEVYSVSSC